MAKAILKMDKIVHRIAKTINTQVVVGTKLLWESRKGKTVQVGNGVRLGEVAAAKSADVKLVVKTRTFATKVSIPASAKKVVITAKLTGLQKIVKHIPWVGKAIVTSALIAGKGLKLTAKAK